MKGSVSIKINGKKTAWGIKCGREYDDKKTGNFNRISKLEKTYFSVFNNREKNSNKVKTIGINRKKIS